MKFILACLVLIFMCGGVMSVSGVSPAIYEVDFEPGYVGQFVFDFVIEGGVSADLYVEGDLMEYVSFDRKGVSGMQVVVVSLELPTEIDSPGVNYVKFGARGGGVDVRGVIKINVPYPEKYVEVGLNAPNVNVGEDVVFELELSGKGSQPTVVSPRIEIYKAGEFIDVVNLENVDILSRQEKSINVSLNTGGYLSGDYLAIAFLDYGEEEVSVSNPFRLGGFSVRLNDYTKYFREDKIERFDIVVENLWAKKMEGVYAEVNILGFDTASLTTSTENLDAWGRRSLVGFLDTSEVDEYKFEAEIILHYGEETVSEVVELNIIKGVDYTLYVCLLVFLLVAVFLIWRGVVFVKKLKKHKDKKKGA